MKTAFIGLGIMGSRMARNVLRGGHALSVFDRSPGKSDVLAGEGARAQASAAGLKDLDFSAVSELYSRKG